MNIGDTILWRWKSHGKAYSEDTIQKINGRMISFSNQWTRFPIWLDSTELDIIVKEGGE